MNYRKQIVNTLTEEGTFERDDAKRKLRYIPDANLAKLVNEDGTLWGSEYQESLDVYLHEAAKAGLLSFKPYIIENLDGVPTLVLKYNRFLHLFRGYYFQVSYTAEGEGCYQTASTRIDYIKYEFRDGFTESRLLKILYYMNCINAGCRIDTFDKLLKENPVIVDRFVAMSVNVIFRNYDITYKDIENLISDVHGNTKEPEMTYRIPKNDTTDVCRLHVYNPCTLGVELMQQSFSKECLVELPNWEDGVSFSSWISEDDREWFNSYIYKNKYVFTQFVSFALNYFGVFINYTVAYPYKTSTYLRASNNPEIITLNNLNDLKVQ